MRREDTTLTLGCGCRVGLGLLGLLKSELLLPRDEQGRLGELLCPFGHGVVRIFNVHRSPELADLEDGFE